MRKSNAHAQKAAALKLQDTKKPPMKIISNATKSTTSQNSTGESTPQSSISKLKVGSATVSDGANKLKTSKISKAETASEAKVQGTGINKRYSQQDTPDHGTARPVTRKGADAGGSPSKEKKKPRKIVRPSAKAQQT
jgi:X-X-X-Leu-X-X-Gly heptad repeat protein